MTATPLVGTVLVVCVVGYALARRTARALAPFTWLAVLVGAWCLLEAAVEIGPSPEIQAWAVKLRMLPAVLVPVAVLLIGLRLWDLRSWLRAGNLALLHAVPVMTLALVFTNELHGWIWSRFDVIPQSGGPVFTSTPGPWSGVQIGFSALVVLAAIGLLISAQGRETERSASGDRARSAGWVGLAVAIALLGGILPIVAPETKALGVSLPVALALCMVPLYAALVVRSPVDSLALARVELFDAIVDPVIAVDSHGEIAGLNPAATTLFAGRDLLGHKVRDRLPPEVAGLVDDGRATPEVGDEESGTLRSVAPAAMADGLELTVYGRCFDARVRSLEVPGDAPGLLIILREITRHRRLRDELELTHAELRKVNQRLLEATHVDPTTGAVKRRTLEARLNEELARSRRHGDPPAVAVLAIDRLERLSIVDGRPDRDRILMTLVRVVEQAKRDSDLIARLGARELGVLLFGSSRTGAEVFAARIRQWVDGLRVHSDTGPLRFTVSVGLAVATPADSGRSLLEQAGAALKKAQAAGGDTVCTAWQTGERVARSSGRGA